MSSVGLDCAVNKLHVLAGEESFLEIHVTWIDREYWYDVSQGIAKIPLNERLTKTVKGNSAHIELSAISSLGTCSTSRSCVTPWQCHTCLEARWTLTTTLTLGGALTSPYHFIGISELLFFHHRWVGVQLEQLVSGNGVSFIGYPKLCYSLLLFV